MPIDTHGNLRAMISRLEDELSENLDNRTVAKRLRKRIDDLQRQLAQSGGYFASNPSGADQRAGEIARAEEMQRAYSEVGNKLFQLKRYFEGIERYYANGQTHADVEIRFKARDLTQELDRMIRSDEFQQLNDEVFFLAEMMKGRKRR